MTGDFDTIPGASFPFIKPLVGFRLEIARQIEKFPFETNVFLMMRFRDTNKLLSDFIIKTLKGASLHGIRADHPDWNITNNVYNPIAVLYCCKYGIALFDEVEANQAYNPNVIYELGMMHCLGRECLILKNDSLPGVPFDLIKDLYMPYKGELAVRTNIQKWLRRIAPDSALPRSRARSKAESELEHAAVASSIGIADEVIETPAEIATAEFRWRASSKTKKMWKVLWSIKLTNSSKQPRVAKVQVLFLDANGFALEDHMSPPTPVLSPGETLLHKATVEMSPDLAKRIQRAMATVSVARK